MQSGPTAVWVQFTLLLIGYVATVAGAMAVGYYYVFYNYGMVAWGVYSVAVMALVLWLPRYLPDIHLARLAAKGVAARRCRPGSDPTTHTGRDA